MLYRVADRIAGFIARWMAYLGGVILVALTLATCVSIIGRELGKVGIGPGPIRGIFELTQIGIGAAIFAFLAYCIYNRGQATVDLLEPFFGKLGNRALDFAADALMLVAVSVVTWRLYLGMQDKLNSYFPETTTILEFPLWLAFAFALVGLIAAVFICAFCTIRTGLTLFGLRPDDSTQEGGE